MDYVKLLQEKYETTKKRDKTELNGRTRRRNSPTGSARDNLTQIISTTYPTN